jgi:hypothetical protein
LTATGRTPTRQNGAVRDDFRLTVDLDDESDGADLVERLAAFELAREERRRFGDRVIVSRDGPRVYFYTATEDAVREVEAVVRAQLAEKRQTARSAVDRWHPIEESWRDADVPLPATAAQEQVERSRMLEREAAESEASGHALWEVRVELPGHSETDVLAERLEDEGLHVVRRYRYLLVGAADREQAQKLAERIGAEAPQDAQVEVEPSGEMVWEVVPTNRFAIFGGLGS